MEFRILGPLEVWARGQRVPLGAGRQRALLGTLLLRPNEVVSAGELAEALWGERPPPTAPKLVQVYVSQLRRSLDGDADVVVTRGRGYVAELGARELDSVRFEELLKAAEDAPTAAALALYEEALALWRGPVLADVVLESHAQPEADRLEELRLTALARRNDCLLALGRDAVAELEALVVRYPLNERFRAQLMLALYRSGRQSDALAEYRDTRATLVHELGIEPSRELQELERAILVHDPSLDAPPPPQRGPARRLAVALAVVLAAAGAVLGFLLTRGSPSPVLARLAPDSIGIVDPQRNALVDAIPLHTRPAAVLVADGALWVSTLDDATLLAFDPRTHRLLASIGLGVVADYLATDGRFIWAVGRHSHALVEVQANIRRVVKTIRLPLTVPIGRGRRAVNWGPYGITTGGGIVWLAGSQGALTRVDARTGAERQLAATPYGGDVAFDGRWVWLVGARPGLTSGFVGVLLRVDPRTSRITAEVDSTDLSASAPAKAIVAAAGVLWGIDQVNRTVWRLDTNTRRVTSVAHLRQGPIGIATGEGAIWTANNDSTVSRIDPTTGAVARTIPLGRYPRVAYPVGLAVGEGRVWVAVR